MKHELKTWPFYFQAIVDKRKNFDIRNFEDRKFSYGDILIFKEYDNKNKRYTGRTTARKIIYIQKFTKFGLKRNWCAIGFNI